MSILNITNLTNTPERDIRANYLAAFEQHGNKSPSIDIQEEYIESQIEWLTEEAENTLGKDLLSLVDNFLVNRDYYDDVREFLLNINN